MRLLGVSGTNGSGKDSLGALLSEKHGYMFISVTELLRDEARKRSLPIERESLRTISAEWRREQGLGVLVSKAIDHFNQNGGEKVYKGLVVSSLRNPGEVDLLHELGGTMVWTDADPVIRYNRTFSRQRTAEDNKTFEEFVAEEEVEMTPIGDSATLDMGAVKKKSDRFLMNNGSTFEELDREITDKLGDIL